MHTVRNGRALLIKQLNLLDLVRLHLVGRPCAMHKNNMFSILRNENVTAE